MTSLREELASLITVRLQEKLVVAVVSQVDAHLRNEVADLYSLPGVTSKPHRLNERIRQSIYEVLTEKPDGNAQS